MESIPFDKLYRQLQDLYNSQEYLAALDLANNSVEQYPEQRTLLDYWRITLSARTGDPALAIRILDEALKNGCWYSELLLRRSPSLKDLQGDPRFEQLLFRNQELAEKDHEQSFPLYTLRSEGKCQPGGQACPLLLGMHTNGGNAQSSMGFWKLAALQGWLVAAPQSSQAIWKGAYVWDDRQMAEQEVQWHFNTLCERYAVDPPRSILAGHSLGGELAIWLTLKGSTAARRFLAIGPAGPWIDQLEQWEPLLHENPLEGLRGAILAGERDRTIRHAAVRSLAEMLKRADIPVRLETVPGAGHDYQPEYDAALGRALEFLSK